MSQRNSATASQRQPVRDGFKRLAGRLLMLARLSVVIIGVQPAAAAVLVVDDDGLASAADCNALSSAFPTISAAEAAASPGDTIKVCPGVYNEMVFINVNDLTFFGAKAGVDGKDASVRPGRRVDHPASLRSGAACCR